MRDSRLIFVDGLTGSGKSTTAQWLCRLLESNGVTASWFHELDMHHPMCRYNEVEEASRSARACEVFHAGARERWRRFVDVAATEDRVSLFDGTLLQVPLYSMQSAMCAEAAIGAHLDEVARIVAPLKPVVVFLSYADPAAAFGRICDARPGFEEYLLGHVRGTPYGRAENVTDRAGLIGLLTKQAALARAWLRLRRIDAVEIEIDEARWDNYRLDIATFLSVPCGDPRPSVDLSGLPGRYLDSASNEMVIDVDGGGLFLRPSGTRLLPKGADTFDLEGISVELTFERERGRAARILCAARVTDFGAVWVRQG